MAQINFRIDEQLKINADNTLSAMGLSMSAAITLFLTKVVNERRIPFEISADPFFSESNIKYLEKKMQKFKAGELPMVEHELIEK